MNFQADTPSTDLLPRITSYNVCYTKLLRYRVNDRFNLRAGFNYGESPIDEASAANNMILPAVVETHYTVGADYIFNEHWDIGCHYMYAPERNNFV